MKKLIVVLILCITFLVYSCAPTYQTVYPEPVNIKSIISPGKTVKITTKEGKEYEIEVIEITDDAIVGENEKVLFTDIHKLQEMTVSSNENTAKGLAGAVFIIIFGAAYGAAGAAGASPGVN